MSIPMSKHLRTASWDQHGGYRPEMPVMGPSASMYNPRLGMTTNSYYPDMAPAPPSLGSDGPTGAPHADYSVYDGTNAPAVVHPHLAHHRASSGAWTQEEDSILLEARQRGLNWNQIQAKYFNKKTPNACRKRHERVMDRRGVDDFDTRRFENMAKEYMPRRKEFWQQLASLTGEKWNVVEAKMLSSGLKNIQSAARAAARRERLASGQPLGPDFDDGMDDIDGMGVDDMDQAYGSPDMPNGHHGPGPDGPGAPNGSSSYAASHLQLPPYYGSHAAHSGHSYTSSMSSAATAAAAAAAQGGYPMEHHHHTSRSNSASQDSSPYVHDQHRLPSVDMGIDAIINRPIVNGSTLYRTTAGPSTQE